MASRAVSAPRRKSVSKGKSSKRQRMAEPDFMGGESGDDISETHDFTSDMIGKCQACSGVITGAQRVMACSALMCNSKMPVMVALCATTKMTSSSVLKESPTGKKRSFLNGQFIWEA